MPYQSQLQPPPIILSSAGANARAPKDSQWKPAECERERESTVPYFTIVPRLACPGRGGHLTPSHMLGAASPVRAAAHVSERSEMGCRERAPLWRHGNKGTRGRVCTALVGKFLVRDPGRAREMGEANGAPEWSADYVVNMGWCSE
jgi:hypothetical protein